MVRKYVLCLVAMALASCGPEEESGDKQAPRVAILSPANAGNPVGVDTETTIQVVVRAEDDGMLKTLSASLEPSLWGFSHQATLEGRADADTFDLFIPANAPSGAIVCRVAVKDGAGNSGEASFSLDVRQGQDFTPPTLSLASPSEGQAATISTWIPIEAMVTDNVGISSFYVALRNASGNMVRDSLVAYPANTTSANVQLNLPIPALSPGNYSLRVFATDGNNNSAEVRRAISLVQ